MALCTNMRFITHAWKESMYYPATRLLTVLELLRARGRMTGNELAERLEVDVRTVRRYIMMLQDLGMPVTTERGRDGGYALRADYRLPPLFFSEDEAVALALGVGFARRLGMDGAVRAAETAIAKMDRVLPAGLRDQVRMLDQVLAMRVTSGGTMDGCGTTLDGDMLLTFSGAIYRHQRVRMVYHTPDKPPTERMLDPYGIVHTIGGWFVVGYCHLRQEIRTFRLDRVASVALTNHTFEPLDGFDALQFVENSIARIPLTWRIDVLVHTTLEQVQQWIAPSTAVMTEEPDGVAVSFSIDDLDVGALYVAQIPGPITLRGPAEMRAALQRLSARIAKIGVGGVGC